jgi:hypothetical protein
MNTRLTPTFDRIVKRAHRIYKWREISPILDFLSSPVLPRGAITKVSSDTGIPVQTLSDWRKHRITEGGETWFPLIEGHPGKRIFSNEQESSMADFIRKNMIEPGNGPVRADVKILTSNAYSSQNYEDFHVERFCASSRFIDGFLDRHKLSLHAPHVERRCNIDPTFATEFLRRLNECPQDYPPDRVFNFDETCWKIFYGPRRVLAPKGCEAVKLKSLTGEKQSVTAFGAISSAGDKLPLWIVTKGRTNRVFAKFGSHPDVIFKFSDSGWATENQIEEYLEWLSERIGKEPCLLILDVYPTHRTEKVKTKAQLLNIELLFVPAGGTSLYQPLDARVFGELKTRARAAFQRLSSINGLQDASYEESIEILVDCWNSISVENIQEAWNVVSIQ